MNIVILGLSITSSWGNGHATTYRGLVRALNERGHQTLFLERDMPWYAANRDMPAPPYGRTVLYSSVDELRARHANAIRDADFVMVGSYVPDGIAVGDWVTATAQGITAFYDIDTPVTLAALGRGNCEYLAAEQIPRYDMYLSFTGGPTLERLEQQYGSPCARPLYCSFDPDMYYPEATELRYDLGYLGTWSADRQPPLGALMLDAARAWSEGRFAVAGPQYPTDVQWPPNVERTEHLPPSQHRQFYNAQRFTLNITRADMRAAGFAPSVRLFEAAACGTPIISDNWPGLDTLFTPNSEILITTSADDTLRYLRDMPESERKAIGERSRARVLGAHTAAHRAAELERYVRATQNSSV
jgi:spore maturation protein CgeB